MYIYGLFGSLLAQMWLWTTAKMPLLYAGHMRNVGRPELEYKSTVAHIRASFALFGWLTCGNAKVYSRPKSDKQDQTAQRPNLGQNYNKCGLFKPALFYLCIVMADMRPSYGLLVAQIWQTGADRPSGIVPRVWAWSGSRE